MAEGLGGMTPPTSFLTLGQRNSQTRDGGGAGRAGAALAPWQLYGKAPKGCCSGGGGGGKGCASIFTVVAVLNSTNTKPVSKKVKDVLGPSGFDYKPSMGKLISGEGLQVDLAPTPATTTTTSKPGGRPCAAGPAGEKTCGGSANEVPRPHVGGPELRTTNAGKAAGVLGTAPSQVSPDKSHMDYSLVLDDIAKTLKEVSTRSLTCS